MQLTFPVDALTFTVDTGLLEFNASATARVISMRWNDDDEISFLVEETGVPGGNHRPTASNWWNGGPCDYAADPLTYAAHILTLQQWPNPLSLAQTHSVREVKTQVKWRLLASQARNHATHLKEFQLELHFPSIYPSRLSCHLGYRLLIRTQMHDLPNHRLGF